MEREQEEERRRQRGHQHRLADGLLELDVLDSSQPARQVVQSETHHGANYRPTQREQEVVHELRRPPTGGWSAARMAASGGGWPVQISKAASPWKSSIVNPFIARAPCSRPPRTKRVTGGWE